MTGGTDFSIGAFGMNIVLHISLRPVLDDEALMLRADAMAAVQDERASKIKGRYIHV